MEESVLFREVSLFQGCPYRGVPLQCGLGYHAKIPILTPLTSLNSNQDTSLIRMLFIRLDEERKRWKERKEVATEQEVEKREGLGFTPGLRVGQWDQFG